MNRFIKELRRREVFRSAGLYIGICWILIEASSVMLPTFGAPEWALRAIIIAAVVGFPVMLVLAWVYNLTAHGIEVQADPTDTVVEPLFSRRMDYIVIGILTVALIFSVYMNVTSGPEIVDEPEPVSVLIADFENTTGNPLFDGLLEQALAIGIESAPHVTSYDREEALRLATSLQSDAQALDSAAARLVAVREGINVVLAGSINPDGSGFELKLGALDAETGEAVFDVTSDAGSPDGVLAAIGNLAAGVREELGDPSLDREKMADVETFTAASLEAAKAYITAQDLSADGQFAEAADYFSKAVDLDPGFGRAYVGWALNAFDQGRTEEAESLWEKALPLLETMTERERLRTLGLYYSTVTRSYDKAIETYQQLVEKYPADDAAHNNLAVLHFFTLDFDAALEAGGKVLDIYPEYPIYRGNQGLYAMYAGEMEVAVAIMEDLLQSDPGYFKGWLPIAMKSLRDRDIEAARNAYANMADAGTDGVPTSLLGLADTEIFAGNFADARSVLEAGIDADIKAGSQYVAAAKIMAIADAYAAEGNVESAADEADRALAVSRNEPWVIGAALHFVDAGRLDDAGVIADELSSQLQQQSRAYGLMISGLIASANNDHVQAIESLRQSAELADLWLVRFSLGKAYLAAGYDAEALDEFMKCKERHGEATALFLDDFPTYRYIVPVDYWLGVAQQQLGMTTASLQSLQSFIDLRPSGGARVDDTRERLNAE